MGFFTHEKCAICNEKVGTFTSIYLNEGVFICSSCAKKAGLSDSFPESSLKVLSINEIKDRINVLTKDKDDNLERIRNFKTTTQFDNDIWFDDENKWFVIPRYGEINDCYVFKYDDVACVEVIEDGDVKYKSGDNIDNNEFFINDVSTKFLCKRLQIKVTTKKDNIKEFYISFVDGEVSRESERYKRIVRDIKSIILKFQHIINGDEIKIEPEVKKIDYSVADEIKKFKELLDMNAITQEEFDMKKKELLNLHK